MVDVVSIEHVDHEEERGEERGRKKAAKEFGQITNSETSKLLQRFGWFRLLSLFINISYDHNIDSIIEIHGGFIYQLNQHQRKLFKCSNEKGF